jgi:hypothetical protein
VEEEMYEEAEHDETEDHDEPLSEAVAPATPPPVCAPFLVTGRLYFSIAPAQLDLVFQSPG